MLHTWKRWTETSLAESGWKYVRGDFCRGCGDMVALYERYKEGRYVRLRLDEGTLEEHNCPGQGS